MQTNSTRHERRRTPVAPIASGARALRTVAGCALAVSCALHAGLSTADDTEVYFSRADAGSNVKPNVLFILDTSGSMNWRVSGGGQRRIDAMKDAVKTMLRQAEDLNIGLMKFHNEEGGPVMFPVTDIDSEVCEGALCGDIVTSASVTGELDDVEEYIDPVTGENKVKTDGSVLELIHDGTRGEEMIGLRFTDLKVPRGATIVEAYLDLTARSDDSGDPVTLDIYSENTGDAATFSGADSAVSSRSWNGIKAAWKLGDWEKAETYASGNIAPVIRAVTDRADWCGGNAISLRLSKNILSTTKKIRQAMTFDHVAGTQEGQTATLRIKYRTDNLAAGGGCMRSSFSTQVAKGNQDSEEYRDGRKHNILMNGRVLDVPRAGSSQQQVGVRFRDVAVPKDATIRRAWLEFHVYGQARGWKAADVSVSIHGEAKNSPGNFGWGRNNISKRNRTTAEVVWEDVPNPPTGTLVRTADVSPIVRELVGRNGWYAGRPMAFILDHHDGGGTRAYTTYEQSRNNAARLVIEFDDVTATSASGGLARRELARDKMIGLVDTLSPAGYTPLVDTLWEATQYYRGAPVDFGKTRGPTQRRYHRVSHPDSYTGGSVYRRSRCTDDNLNASDCQYEVITGAAVYDSPVENSCQTNHIVLLSDGQANGNVSADRIRGLTGLSSCAVNSGNEACGLELATWLNETDLDDSIRNQQNVRLHTIGFDLTDETFLQTLASKGGGSLYSASDSSSLLNVFRSIINDVNSIDTSFTAPGATVNQFNRLTHRDDIYFAMFKPTDTPRWSGNLKKFRIGKAKTATAGVVTGEVEIRDRNDDLAVDEETGFFADSAFSFWEERDDAGAEIAKPDGHDVKRGGAANQMALDGLAHIGKRRTYTWVGSADGVPSDGVDLTAGEQELDEDNDVVTLAALGIDGYGDNETEREDYREQLLKWARGVDVQDDDNDLQRNDSRHHMGDPMHSRPVILNYADNSAGSVDGVRSIVFVATNEGYVHAIDAASGEERFAFMPNELLGNLHTQFQNNAGTTHPYGIDGPLSIWREDNSGNKHVVDAGDKAYLYFGMRRGGHNYYALDVSSLDSPRLAWAIKGGENPTTGFEELGQSWSRLTPVRMMIEGSVKDVLLFGAGYDTEQDTGQTATGTVQQKGRGLYIVEASSGDLLWSGLGKTGAGDQTFEGMSYPIPGNVRAIDLNRNELVDQIYAADTGGQLWRFDVNEAHGSGDELMQGGIIADFSGADADTRRRFYAEPDVALIEQEGQRFLTVAVGSGWRASPLDLDVEDRFYVVRQNDIGQKPAAGAYGVKDDDGTYRPVTDADLLVAGTSPGADANGWYLDMRRSGEKVLGTSITFDNSVIFSSYVPQATANDCSTGIGGGRAYILDIVSGAAKNGLDEDDDEDGSTTTDPEQEGWDEDGSKALKHGGLPPDAMIMITEDSGDDPEVLFGSEKMPAGVRNSTRRTFWSDVGAPEESASESGDENEQGEENGDELAESDPN